MQQVDNRVTIDAIQLTPAQRALLVTVRRLLLALLKEINALLGK